MNILVIYYSQSGQIKTILDEITKPFTTEGNNVDFVQIEAEPKYPFPWKSDEFFSVFPDSKKGNNCQLKPLSFQNPEKYDLIIVGMQVWFLELSIPMASFLRSEYSSIFKNKPVITVYGIRNMWVNAHKTTKTLICKAGGIPVGNIVLQDKHNNLVSVLSIVRWLINGKKSAGKLLPEAGVSEYDIRSSHRFGSIIIRSKDNNFNDLHDELIKNDAFKIDYHIMKTEFAGSRIFGIWARLIQKKSIPSTKKRKKQLRIFKYYLFFVIFVVSPISSFIFRMIRILLRNKTEREIQKHTALDI
jgi:menaquinone-dependent protoporphyrinogen IX oxidase